MQQVWQELTTFGSNPVVSLSSLAIGILGVLLAIIFYMKTKRCKELKYAVLNRTVINQPEKELRGLQVTYNSVPQQRVTVSRIVILNSGTETIRLEDIPNKAPLSINIPRDNIQVLDLSLAKVTNKASCFIVGDVETGETEISVPLSFEYMDQQDGVTVQIIHNGTEDTKIKVTGKIIGGKGPLLTDIKGDLSPRFYSRAFEFTQSELSMAAFYGCAGIVLLILRLFMGSGWGYIVGGILFLFISLSFYSEGKRKAPIRLLREL